MTPPNPTEALTIVNCFLPSQEITPLSGGSDGVTASRLVESGIPLATIAEADIGPDIHSGVFEHAVSETLRVHEETGATRHTTEDGVRRGLPGAFRINKNIALRMIMGAATGQEFPDVVTAIGPSDEGVAEAQAVLDTPEGRERVAGILDTITEFTRAGDTTETSLAAQYRAAQLGRSSEAFPGKPANNRETRRLELRAHQARRLGPLAVSDDPHLRAAVRAFLQDEVDPVSLRLGQGY